MFSLERELDKLELGPAERKRWYILIIFSVVSGLQCNIWFTFSSAPSEFEDYYGLTHPSDDKVNSVIDLLLNWGPIIFIPATPFAVYLLLYPIKGLRYTVLLAVNLSFFGCLIRSIPTILQDLNVLNYKVSSSFWNCIIFLHIGQILNAASGPLVMGPPSKLSVIWFPDNQRKTATGIAAISNTFGTCIGFLLGPFLIGNNSDNVRYVLYLDLILIFIPWIFIMIYFPSSPTKLPSIAGKAALLSIPVKKLDEFVDLMHYRSSTQNVTTPSISVWNAKNSNEVETAIGNNDKLLGASFYGSDLNHIASVIPYSSKDFTLKKHFINLMAECKCILLSLSTLCIVLVGGLQIGVFAAWSGVLQDMIGSSSGLGLSDKNIGIIGFITTGMTIFGGIIMGPISDKYFAKQLKKATLILFYLTIICLGILLFILPSPFSNKPLIILMDDDSTSKKMIILNIITGIMGFVLGASTPLFYELCVEVSYPVSEGSSATFLVFITNVVCLIFVGIGNWISTKWETFLALIVCVVCQRKISKNMISNNSESLFF